MIKLSLILLSLSLSACGSVVPEFPQILQCAYSIKFNKFRCVNSKTGEAFNLPRDFAAMEGAQCMTLDDYRKSEAWVASVKAIAERRCK